MNKLKQLFLAALVLFLSSCSSVPERIKSSDIPSWCKENEGSNSDLPYLKNGVSKLSQIAEEFSGDEFMACGVATGPDLGKTKTESLNNAKKEILNQLLGRVLSKIKSDELINNYKDKLNPNSFGFEVDEFKSMDIKSGYTMFTLIEVSGKELLSTIEPLKNPDMITVAEEESSNEESFF